ncbi:hypothetical protein ASD00_31280 [Ensifer sp. Root31]|uniref:cupin domain-containing protein n=1 Tax=Ensifer sp. Root31 TaxID=1736512 RepID=UPI00070FB7AB|nr:cupin domain-containing protein [Ensifer sp. Root31]KQU86374.1 hypothetical protein ASD00_31280 [Ensifer sp. Root31]
MSSTTIGGRHVRPLLPILGGVVLAAMVAAGAIVSLGQKESVDSIDETASNLCDPSRPRELPEVVRIDPLGQLPGNRAIIARVHFPPNACAGAHTHGGTVSVYVVSGMIRSQLQGEPAHVYGPGQTFFEHPGAVHLIAENVSDTLPAEIVAFHVLGEQEEVTVFAK